MFLRELADRVVAANREGRVEALLTSDYAPHAVSVEAVAMDPSAGRETSGLDAIRGKHAWWDENMEMHGGTVDGPFLHGDDRFAVIYESDFTEKATGKRHHFKEIGVYHAADGKIVREEFFYTP